MTTDDLLGGFAPGDVVANRYRMVGLLGSGGMAQVYEVVDTDTNERRALKLLRSDIAENAEAVARIRREGELLSNLAHPAIVQALDIGAVGDGRLFIAMEFLEGETLGQRMRTRGQLSPIDLLPIVHGTAAALSAAHRAGVVHRDLKPDNVFLCRGNPETTKLLDFGISKVFGGKRLTHTGQVLGTPRYMAPEQLSAERDLDGRVDIYAFGVILYEALAGVPPFVANTPSDLIVAIINGKATPLRLHRADLSIELENLIARAMATNRNDRFETPADLRDAYDALVRDFAPRGPTPRAPAAAPLPGLRPGMSTNAMGTMGPDAIEPPELRDAGPGTFGARGMQPIAGPRVVPKTRVSGPFPSAVEVPASIPEATRSPSVPAAVVPVMEDSEARAESPIGGIARAAIVLLALIAGGAVAAGVIAGLRHFGYLGARGDVPPPVSAPASGAPHSSEVPLGEELPLEVVVPDEPTSEEPPASPSGPDSPSEEEAAIGTGRVRLLFLNARTSFRSGDPQRCIALVEEAQSLGAPLPILQLYGDCLLAAGRREDALKAFGRLCRSMPNHPRARYTRRRVEELGGHCP